MVKCHTHTRQIEMKYLIQAATAVKSIILYIQSTLLIYKLASSKNLLPLWDAFFLKKNIVFHLQSLISDMFKLLFLLDCVCNPIISK